MPEIAVKPLADSLDFGYGKISSAAVTLEARSALKKTITSDPNILVPVEAGDDGCGDGREVVTVFSKDTHYNRSLNRSKVFGGGATMAAAITIGTGKGGDRALNTIFSDSIAELSQAGVDFGAHTDEGRNAEKCGCGAIDCAPDALTAALIYENPIRAVIAGLDGVNDSEINAVFVNYRDYVPAFLTRQENFDSARVMDEIITSESKVVKQLGGAHHESGIVLNEVRGYTVNQGLVREATGNQAQTFAVDIWRLQDIAAKLSGGDKKLGQQALLSELVYTLAIAAVLTKGDLPVYKIEQAEVGSTDIRT
jgi:hypothetical protein